MKWEEVDTNPVIKMSSEFGTVSWRPFDLRHFLSYSRRFYSESQKYLSLRSLSMISISIVNLATKINGKKNRDVGQPKDKKGKGKFRTNHQREKLE